MISLNETVKHRVNQSFPLGGRLCSAILCQGEIHKQILKIVRKIDDGDLTKKRKKCKPFHVDSDGQLHKQSLYLGIGFPGPVLYLKISDLLFGRIRHAAEMK